MKRIISLFAAALIGATFFAACGEKTAGASDDPNTIIASNSSSSAQSSSGKQDGDISGDIVVDVCDTCDYGTQSTRPQEELVRNDRCDITLYPLTNSIFASFLNCKMDSTNVYERVTVETYKLGESVSYSLEGEFSWESQSCNDNYEKFIEGCIARGGSFVENIADCSEGALDLSCNTTYTSKEDLLRDLAKDVANWCNAMEMSAACPEQQ